MNTLHDKKYALVYTRVSSLKQKTEGSGDASQEVRCIEYAKQRGYIYDKTFEDVYTGGGSYLYRKGVVRLLEYIDQNKDRQFVVIFDDLKRFARDVKFHIMLREELDGRGVLLDSPNFRFDNTPEGEANELHTAVSNQLERKQNQRQVIQKQTARLIDGYWPFHASIGYSMRKVEGFGKIMFPNEKAKVVKEALEGFASMRFLRKLDVAIFLQKEGALRNQPPEKYLTTVTKLLNNSIYAGFIEYPKRGIERRKGKHEALISPETFERIQRRVKKPDGARIRLDIREDFPIRGFVDCAECGNKITAGWSTGRHGKKYAYYTCCTSGCSLKGKTIKRDVIEREFSKLLLKTETTDEIVEYATVVYDDAWALSIDNRGKEDEICKDEIVSSDQEISSLIDLSYKTQSDIVRTQYERRIELLGVRIKELEKLLKEKPTEYRVSFRTALTRVLSFLKSPYTAWKQAPLLEKYKLYYFLFEERLVYAKNEGFRTAKLAVGIRVLESFFNSKTDHVHVDENTLKQLYDYTYKVYSFLEQNPSLSSTSLPLDEAA